jgi:hypothetical protein
MNRDTRIRVWDALKGDKGEYLGHDTTVTSIALGTAVSLGVSGTHPGSCDWDIEFETGAVDRDGTHVFQGDIINDSEWFYVVRFGQAWIPFGDTRDGVDDIGGQVRGFYYEPLEPEQGELLAKRIGSGLRKKNHDEHNRALSVPAGNIKVVANIRQNPELVEE